MITITFIGSDRYVVGQYSKEVTKKLANLWEVSEDEILFLAPEYYVYHDGVEQTSYQVLIRVEAPIECRAVEKEVAAFLMKMAEPFIIHLTVQFSYTHNREYHHINEEYPRYITEENEVLLEEEEYDDDTEIYEGDMFENFEERLRERQAQMDQEAHEHHHGDECHCEEHHHDGDCCCHDDHHHHHH